MIIEFHNNFSTLKQKKPYWISLVHPCYMGIAEGRADLLKNLSEQIENHIKNFKDMCTARPKVLQIVLIQSQNTVAPLVNLFTSNEQTQAKIKEARNVLFFQMGFIAGLLQTDNLARDAKFLPKEFAVKILKSLKKSLKAHFECGSVMPKYIGFAAPESNPEAASDTNGDDE